MSHHSRKEDKELVQAILGGEMRNAWQPTVPGESKDTRTQKAPWLYRTNAYRDNYDRIFNQKE